jgi:hypothetical protein
MAKRVTFQYLVPVMVEVEDGRVISVTIIDSTPIRDPVLVSGSEDALEAAVKVADSLDAWPTWQFE